jgi:hypothetical protein
LLSAWRVFLFLPPKCAAPGGGGGNADLAGSESVGKSQVEGARLEESKKINTSLLALVRAPRQAVARTCLPPKPKELRHGWVRGRS